MLDHGWNMGVLPHEQARHLKLSNLSELSHHTTIHEATVPGCMELDLQRAGILKDPYLGSNVLKLQELEEYHAYYAVSFFPGRKTELLSGTQF